MKLRIFSRWRILLVLGAIGILCISIWILLNLYLDAPVYEPLKINSPSSYLLNGGWNTEIYTVETHEGDREKFFIWRVEDDLSFKEVGVTEHYSSEDELLESLIDWFVDNGWKQEDLITNDVCSIMPESKFLVADSKFGYFGFRRSNANSDAYLPTACVAVWKYERFQRYYFVVTTISPSRRTYFLRCVEVSCK